MEPRSITAMSELDAYNYELPPGLVAQRPLARRTDARLLLVDRQRGTFEHWRVRDLPDLLRPRDCLVINDTRVVPARLVGRRTATGGRWEGLFITVDETGVWRLLGKTRGKIQPGETVTLHGRRGQDDVRLAMMTRLEGGVWLARPESHEDAWTILDRVGRVPLPHYIRHGEMAPLDRERYQTVFARQPGAVAAPTAGLHFTDALLKRLVEAGIAVCRVTLHVGLDTFRPITTALLGEHKMHAEWGQIRPEAVELIQQRRREGGRVVAVGTTSVRVLETAAACGELGPWSGETRLFIRPPYQFRAVEGLLTNFHLPRTTLLVLVRTFGGDDLIMRAYQEAIRHDYRFYSYGDAMLIV